MKNIFKISLLAIAFLTAVTASNAQIQIGGYVDGYIRTDNNTLSTEDPFMGSDYSFDLTNPREGAFGLNLAMIYLKAMNDTWRGNVTFQYGDFPTNAGWSVGGNPLGILQQGWGGVKLFGGLWLDAGYFISHIRSEDVVPMNNFLTTTSMLSAVEPWTMGGFKLSYDFTDYIHTSLYILNNMGTFEENNFNKSLGLSIGYQPKDMDLTIGYNGVFGNSIAGDPVNSKFGTWNNINIGAPGISDFVDIRFSFDFGYMADAVAIDNSTEDGTLIGTSLAGKFGLIKEISGALRFSYVNNEDRIAFNSRFPMTSGFDVTLGVEYNPTENSYLRLEGQYLNFTKGDVSNGTPGNIFRDGNDELTNNRLGLVLAMGLRLQ